MAPAPNNNCAALAIVLLLGFSALLLVGTWSAVLESERIAACAGHRQKGTRL